MSDELQACQMQDRFTKDREMSEWQVAIVTLLIAIVVAALAWAVVDPEGVSIAADASTRFWNALHERQFSP
jgi:membrane protein YdbS with pleckstrin-like domain